MVLQKGARIDDAWDLRNCAFNGQLVSRIFRPMTCQLPLIFSSCIHSYFALRDIPWKKIFSSLGDVFESKTCPHCQHDLRNNWRRAAREGSPHSHDSKEDYDDSPVIVDNNGDEVRPSSSKGPKARSAYKEPRPSTDDESASLV